MVFFLPTAHLNYIESVSPNNIRERMLPNLVAMVSNHLLKWTSAIFPLSPPPDRASEIALFVISLWPENVVSPSKTKKTWFLGKIPSFTYGHIVRVKIRKSQEANLKCSDCPKRINCSEFATTGTLTLEDPLRFDLYLLPSLLLQLKKCWFPWLFCLYQVHVPIGAKSCK